MVKQLGQALFFETLENVPLFFGGVLAVWWVRQGLGETALGAGLLGSGGAALAIHYGERYQSPDFQATWRKTLFNFAAFVVCIAVLSGYFRLSPLGSWWDVAAGLLLGLLLTVLESPSFTTRRGWWRHALAMMAATAVGVLVLRGLISQDSLGAVVAATLALVVLLSVLITVLEYWPQFARQSEKLES